MDIDKQPRWYKGNSFCWTQVFCSRKTHMILKHVATARPTQRSSRCQDAIITSSHAGMECLGMEERCDQVLDCTDESDEVGCKTVVLNTSYMKTAPPVTLQREEWVCTVKPALVKVSVTLMDIVGIREVENKIDIKFSTELEWNETRALYNNLRRTCLKIY